MLTETSNIEKKIIFDEPMKKHTSFKIGGIADLFLKVNSIEELKDAIRYAKENNISMQFIGNGSNILVTDKGIRGLVVKIDIDNIQMENKKDNYEIKVGAGCKMMVLAQYLLNHELTGFEELSGIPGTIGGAIYMNAGAYGKEIKDLCLSTKCMDLDGKFYELSNEAQKFSYRKSIFSENKYIILETTLKLKKGKKEEIREKMNELLTKRKEKQPIEYPSAGSSFKRKDNIITAKLIDECGLRGYSIGGAKVSEKHAGFIVNYNNATAKDVLDLIKYIKEKVYDKYGIRIEEEIKVIGEE